MKIKFKQAHPPRTKSYLKHKLISATALLLVSSIMLVSTSYAWYVLSTAPEVTNIKTQVGANGALEIALLNADSWNNLDLLDMGDIDESVTDENPIAATVANLTWGNLVNLDDNSYGLDKITLNPSRLYIEQDGSDVSGDHKVNSVLLKTPTYGEDGRVKGLDKTAAVAYSFANGTFSNANGYGVRAIGTSASMSVFQLGMNAARSTLVTYSSASRTAASNALQNTGGALANVVVAYALSKQMDGYKNTDVAQVRNLAEGMQSSLGEIETALRQVFAGYITTAKAAELDGVTAENYQTKLAEITNTGEGKKTLAALRSEYPGISEVIPSIDVYITVLTDNQNEVEHAIDACDALTDDNHTWTEISSIITPLMNTNAMLVNGKTIDELQEQVRNEDGSINQQEALNLVQGGITITVPSGSGLLSDIADYAGNYTANVTVYPKMTVGGFTLDGSVGMDVAMTTATAENPVYLTKGSNDLKAADVADAAGSNSITDYYGYAIDLAFRTNAEDSNLLLQTEPENRIYEGDNRNASLQGAGSYMSFTTTAGLSATKMVKLMSGIRVVLMDGTQKVLAIAALDTALGKEDYVVLDDETKAETGMYAYLDGSAGAYQNSDLIDATTYNALPDESRVEFNKTTGKVTAKLYLYNYEMTRSSTSTADEVKYTGGLTLGGKIENGVITALTPDVPQRVTALVYLDGSFVNNSMVAANSAQSMAGILNLQFSSSATLVPAEITKLQTEGSAVNYTVMEGELYEAGYLYYNGYLGKVKDGYTFYEGSDDKFYFATAASEYTELTLESAATALDFVTVKLKTGTGTEIGNSLSLAAGETVEFTAALSVEDENLVVNRSGTATFTNEAVKITLSNETLTGTIEGIAAGSASSQVDLLVSVKRADGSSGSMSYAVKSLPITFNVTDAA